MIEDLDEKSLIEVKRFEGLRRKIENERK